MVESPQKGDMSIGSPMTVGTEPQVNKILNNDGTNEGGVVIDHMGNSDMSANVTEQNTNNGNNNKNNDSRGQITFQAFNNPKRAQTSKSGLNLSRAASRDLGEPTKVPLKTTLFLSFSALGSIYGDIATSPLYTLATIFNDSDKGLTEKDILGGVSCVFWLFTIVAIFKYGLIVLFYGPNKGEGGQIAIYTKIASALSIGPQIIDEHADDVNANLSSGGDDVSDLLSRTRTSDSSYYHNSPFVSKVLSKVILFLCFLGCSLVISDGLLTPTTSVLSAVEGIQVQAPEIGNAVLPISCVVLIFLFSIQRFGSGKVSLMFAPIIAIWLALIGGIGIYNITLYPTILKAFNPVIAVDYLVKKGGINVLGSIMLCITGTEAMFADIGHFGRLPVQLTLVSYVYPCLIMAYFGQGAYLVLHPDAVSTIFYTSIPGGKPLFWIVFVVAVMATIIASQALILGVFSILRQLIQIDCFPSFKIVHSSQANYGQVYIPTVNFILMIGVIATTCGYQTSDRVAAAYGLGISLDFFCTTCLITIAMVYVYKFNFLVPLCFFFGFGCVDMIMIISNMKKVIHGAWFPLALAVIFTSFISFWYWGRSSVKENFQHPILLEKDFDENNEGNNGVTKEKYFESITFLYAKNINITPEFIINSLDSIQVFVNTSVKAVPYLSPYHDEVTVKRLSPGFYKATVNFGFMDDLVVDTVVLEKIIGHLSRDDIHAISQLSDVDVIHVIEGERVRAKRNFYFYAGDSNSIIGKIMTKWFGFCNVLRRYLIEYLFSTIHDLFNSNDILDNELILGEGENEIIYLGSIVRI